MDPTEPGRREEEEAMGDREREAGETEEEVEGEGFRAGGRDFELLQEEEDLFLLREVRVGACILFPHQKVEMEDRG